MERERHIEKLLRAFAKKRKADAGAPLELHPATRRLLQGEIARGRKATPRKGGSFWQILFATPRRAFAVCALASLLITGAVVLIIWNKPGSPMALAKNNGKAVERTHEINLAEQPVTAMTPTPRSEMPALVARKDSEKENGTATLHGLMLTNGMNAPLLASSDLATKSSISGSVTTGLEDKSAASSMSDAVNFGFMDATTASVNQAANRDAAVIPAAALVWAGSGSQKLDDSKTFERSTGTTLNYFAGAEFQKMEKTKADGQLATQRFYRMRLTDTRKDDAEKNRTLNKQAAGEVLDTFAVEQDGDKITVVDSDGSKYSGRVKQRVVSEDLGLAAQQPVGRTSGAGGSGTSFGSVGPGRRAAAPEAAAVMNIAPGQTLAPTPDLYFEVMGTNVSLNQLVVFRGNLVTITNSFGFSAVFMTNSIGGMPANAQQNLWQNSRIEGRAEVGEKPGVVIEAEPVGR